MLSLNQIRNDLKDIRYYYARKDMFDKYFEDTGENHIIEIVKKYHGAIKSAPIRLYDLYTSLYINNNTQEVLAEDLNFTPEYIQKLNSKLLKFLQEYFLTIENDKKGDWIWKFL